MTSVAKTIKYITNRLYKPLVAKYLSSERKYTYKGIQLTVPPEVFHPGFFFSTRLLLRYINTLPLQQQTLLEPGAGSGLISLWAAKNGAMATATDINPVAVEYLHKNSTYNQLPLHIIQSDLFNDIPAVPFDIIAINPPYYRKQPQSYADYAWYCGEQGEYFERLFMGLGNYMHARSVVVMILSDGCDIPLIREMAYQQGFIMKCMQTSKNWIENNFIFIIQPAAGKQ